MLLILYLFILIFFAGASQAQLRPGFYQATCPDAENIVRRVVTEAISGEKAYAPRLLRVHFHDCFVEGCDGSILIDRGPDSEKEAFGHEGLGGFDVIEKAKAELEAACPATVSCSDIVALAARDAIVQSNGPSYEVELGRRDGMVSQKSLADNMPGVEDSIQVLRDKFRQKGLNDKDLVVLSAAHTIGTTACFFMTQRLYDFPVPGGGSDPSIDPRILPDLEKTCPKGGVPEVRLAMDRGSEDVFDNSILANIRTGDAVLKSDAQLYADPNTRAVVDSYFAFLSPVFGPKFEQDFAAAMVKMGRIGVKTGTQGNIRRVCSAFK